MVDQVIIALGTSLNIATVRNYMVFIPRNVYMLIFLYVFF